MARSSYAPSEDSYSRYAPSSPISYAGEDAQSPDPGVKPMRLKVLYTTDDKTNCMARWPRVLQVRTAFLDEKTEIGVVEIKTCIKAIVTSSPELVAKLGHDYTVYAYDYSEYEVPLVGQGMLSWVLASASSTPTAPASQSSTMVTGRVTKNANALFGRDSVAQTLEVKLRLVPVPTLMQSEYIDSMKKYRDISRVMPDTFDPQGWTDFLKANPQVISMMGVPGQGSPHDASHGSMGLEQVQKLMQSGISQATLSRRGSFAESIVSRDASPTPSVQTAVPDTRYEQSRRPFPQSSSRELRRTVSTGQIQGSDLDANDDSFEDGPARKRARITQVKRPGKNAGFGKQVESLRVAASTANSVRVLQPTAIRPGIDNSLEEPPRAPTPVPQNGGCGPRRPALQSRSSLGRFATAVSSDYNSHFQDQEMTLHSVATSPEANSVIESSPGEDPGSSPPVPASRVVNMAPSSPQLPRMPMHEDSGFMSGTIDETLDTDAKATKPSVEAQSSLRSDMFRHTNVAQQPKPRRLAAKLPRADSTASHLTSEEQASELSRRNALRAIGWRRVQSFSEGQNASSDPAGPASESSKQPRPLGQDRPKSKHAYDKEKQKERVHNRLMNALAAGERPPMCENCGTVQSHTWRKAYKKKHSGSPTDVRTGRGPGAVLTVLVEERDENDEVTVFSIVKKSLAPEDEAFDDMLLCNPCGLWLGSKGEMRPPRVWNQAKINQPKPKDMVGPSSTIGYHDSSLHPYSINVGPSDVSEPPSEAPLAPFHSHFDERHANNMPTTNREDSNDQEQDNEPELPTLPEARQAGHVNNSKSRSDSAMPAGAVAALQKAIRSSPGQFRGSKQSPINVDTTPTTTRRTLFPSPKTKGPLSTSTGNRRGSLQDSPDAPRQYKQDQETPAIAVQDASNKENMMPPPPPPKRHSPGETGDRATTPSAREEEDDNDYFGELFRDPGAPSTPSRSRNITLPPPKSPSNTFKTPTKTTPQHANAIANFFSSAEKAFLHGHPSTPTRTPSRTSAKGTPGSINDTPFTRQLKSLFSADPPTFEMDTSPSKVFGDLHMIGDDFTDWPMTTDMPMPSSPPITKSNVQLLKTPGPKEDGNKDDDDSPSWDDLGLGKTPGFSSGQTGQQEVTNFP